MTVPDSAPGNAYLPGPGEHWTPIRITRWSGEYLGAKGIRDGRLDAELLLAHVLGLTRLDLYLQHDRPLKPDELEAFKALLKRRASREPLQYVIGTTGFRELELITDARALIPRPETEVLVGEVLAWATRSPSVSSNGGGVRSLTALDLGTGSGAIALSLLKEGPFSRVVATDSSSAALELARENAERHSLLDRLDLREGPLFEPLERDELFDVIVSNPPYIPDGDRESLQEEIRRWEPERALYAGPEGLAILSVLVRDGPAFLTPGGMMAVEVGDGQANEIVRTMEETGRFGQIRVVADLSDRERVVWGVAAE